MERKVLNYELLKEQQEEIARRKKAAILAKQKQIQEEIDMLRDESQFVGALVFIFIFPFLFSHFYFYFHENRRVLIVQQCLMHKELLKEEKQQWDWSLNLIL